MLVIDASALVEVLIVVPEEIPELFSRVREADWMSAPELLDYEVLNVLRKLVLRGDTDAEVAQSCLLALRDLRLSRHSLGEEMAGRVWELRHGMSSYDAAYVALAEKLDVPLITADRRLADAAEQLSPARIERFCR